MATCAQQLPFASVLLEPTTMQISQASTTVYIGLIFKHTFLIIDADMNF